MADFEFANCRKLLQKFVKKSGRSRSKSMLYDNKDLTEYRLDRVFDDAHPFLEFFDRTCQRG